MCVSNYELTKKSRSARFLGKAGAILDALLYRGELPRSEVADVLGTSPRAARRIVSALVDQDVITSDTPKGDLRITFPARLASRWMPGLFPEHPG